MKIIIQSIVCLLISLPVFAQVELEHSLNKSEYIYPMTNLLEDDFFMSFDTKNQTINIRKSDFEMYKQIAFESILGRRIQTLNYLSRNLFNEDDKMEFLVGIYNPAKRKTFFKILNEDNETIADLGTASTAFIMKIGGENKLVVRSAKTTLASVAMEDEYTDKIYSIPGAKFDLNQR